MKKFILAVALSTAAVTVPVMDGQAVSVNGGAIQGTITDAAGASVAGASIEIRNKEEGTSKTITTDKSGFYSIGPLNPGEYVITVASPGFQRLEVTTRVLTGTATPGSFKLNVGQSTETVEVTAGDIQVNTDQPGVSDVITREQIANLPVNGRNFLDLAQIEPGVQLQNGNTFDPTKSGYTGISVNGVSGRTTRILLDGQDITDEFVGTTIINVSQGAISEFQLNRSTQDVSGEVTSQGQVLVSTRSGTNSIHGELFYDFQDQRSLFANPNALGTKIPPYFQRNQFGGSVGGPIIKDKLFYFGNSERIQQHSASPSGVGSVFASTIGAQVPTVGTPYKETNSTARLDYAGPFGGHYFARGNYDVNSTLTAAGTSFYSAYANRDNTYGIAFGADFARGRYTHSLRGSYEKFHNYIGDASATSGYDPLANVSGAAGPVAYRYAGQIYFGPNANAPQATYQSDKQLRYDGGYTVGAHNIRFGGAMNRIQSGAYAAFYGIGPRINVTASNGFTGPTTANKNALGCGGVAGAAACLGDPLNGYFTSSVTLGNGQGYSNSVPGFGLPGGGIAAWRFSGYGSDAWKVTPNLTLAAGVRYSVDTNRENNAVTLPTCGDLGASVASACSGLSSTTALFTLFNPSYTQTHVRQPYGNISPQAGLVYAPGNHKTTFRAGFGLFYESVVFNNTSNAESTFLKSGAFYYSKNPCTSGSYTLASGTVVTTSPNGTPLTTLCAQPISQSAAQFSQLEKQLQTDTAANSNTVNGSFAGTTLSVSGSYAPNYRQPYSEQWNFGTQHELFKGAVLSADYVHNTGLKLGQTIDQNHNGAARNFRVASVAPSVTAAATKYKVGTAFPCATAIGTTNQINCLISNGATIATLATNGLGSTSDYSSSTSYLYAGQTRPAAFAGTNAVLGSGSFIVPSGRSGYDALQLVYRQSTEHPLPGIEHGNFQVSYNLSRIVSNLVSTTGDQFFTSAAYDNDNPDTYIGRNGLDRKHELSFGGSFTFKYGPKFGLIGHFFSAQPGNLSLDTGSLATGNIFQSDLTGDGTTGDLAPGTLQGDYMHRVKSNTLAGFINNFNAQYAGKPTPAGQALINSGTFTLAQLTALKGVVQPVAAVAQTNGVNNPMFRSMDVNFSYPIRFYKFHEGLSLEPSIAFYNVGNFSNFSNVSTTLQNTTTAGGAINSGGGGQGYASGVDNFGVESARRTYRGVGTFSQGAPRETEYQLKLNF